MSECASTPDLSNVSAAHFFQGTLVGETDDGALFKTPYGKVLMLQGVARQVCEEGLSRASELSSILSQLSIPSVLAGQLSFSLVALGLFAPEKKPGFWNRFKSLRLKTSIDFPLLPATMVNWLCLVIHRTKFAIFPLLLFLSLAGCIFLLSHGFSLKPGMIGFDQGRLLGWGLVALIAHELGHAYCLFYFGQRPGRVGLRIFGPIIAAYTDVNAAWLLPPKQRALVNLAGVCVQALVVVPISVYLYVSQGPVDAWLFLNANLFAICYMIIPFRENDGDWLIRDLGEASTNPNIKRGIALFRTIFAWLGLLMFSFFIVKGWLTVNELPRQLDVTRENMAICIVILFYLSLGTFSLVMMTKKQLLELKESMKKNRIQHHSPQSTC